MRYADFLQVVARRLQTKETVDQLLVRIISQNLFLGYALCLFAMIDSLTIKCRKHSRHSTKRIEVLGESLEEIFLRNHYANDCAVAGTIAPEELRHILSTFGEVMDQAEIEEFLAEADLKCPDYRANGEKTGLINYFAFVGLILDIPELETIPQTVSQSSCTIRTQPI